MEGGGVVDAGEVRPGQVRVDDDGDLYKVVEVDEWWAWVRVMHREKRTLHGKPKRARLDQVARWLEVVA